MDARIEPVRRAESLMLVAGGYKRLTDVLFTFQKPRPGPGWNVHGWLTVKRRIADVDGRVRAVTLKKRNHSLCHGLQGSGTLARRQLSCQVVSNAGLKVVPRPCFQFQRSSSSTELPRSPTRINVSASHFSGSTP